MKLILNLGLVIAITLLSTTSNCQKPDHLFVYLEDILDDKVKITYGDHVLEDEKLVKDSISMDDSYFYQQLAQTLNRLSVEKRNILFYIHGLWADKISFSETSGYILHEDVFAQEDSPYGLIISLQWSGNFNYLEDYDITKKAGNEYAPLVRNIINKATNINNDFTSAFLLHSMGHQVFYHLASVDKEGTNLSTAKKIIFCAADIRDTILQDPIIKNLVCNTNSTLIFKNENDRTLKMARMAVAGERLGITGPKNISDIPSNVHIIDVSDFNDFESKPGKMSLHRYYYDSPKARKIIKEALSTL